MSYIIADNFDEQKMFDFLEDLRQSGDTNMVGAGPYVREAFGLDRAEANAVVSKWMKLHDDPARHAIGPASKTKTEVKFRTEADVKTTNRGS